MGPTRVRKTKWSLVCDRISWWVPGNKKTSQVFSKRIYISPGALCRSPRHSHRRRLQIRVVCAPKVEAESPTDFEPFTGEPYKLRWPEGLEVQKGSVLSEVHLLRLHCREMVIPNIAKFLSSTGEWYNNGTPWSKGEHNLVRFIAPMPAPMKISWTCLHTWCNHLSLFSSWQLPSKCRLFLQDCEIVAAIISESVQKN